MLGAADLRNTAETVQLPKSESAVQPSPRHCAVGSRDTCLVPNVRVSASKTGSLRATCEPPSSFGSQSSPIPPPQHPVRYKTSSLHQAAGSRSISWPARSRSRVRIRHKPAISLVQTQGSVWHLPIMLVCPRARRYAVSRSGAVLLFRSAAGTNAFLDTCNACMHAPLQKAIHSTRLNTAGKLAANNGQCQLWCQYGVQY
jgi:hypothetical protein